MQFSATELPTDTRGHTTVQTSGDQNSHLRLLMCQHACVYRALALHRIDESIHQHPTNTSRSAELAKSLHCKAAMDVKYASSRVGCELRRA